MSKVSIIDGEFFENDKRLSSKEVLERLNCEIVYELVTEQPNGVITSDGIFKTVEAAIACVVAANKAKEPLDRSGQRNTEEVITLVPQTFGMSLDNHELKPMMTWIRRRKNDVWYTDKLGADTSLVTQAQIESALDGHEYEPSALGESPKPTDKILH